MLTNEQRAHDLALYLLNDRKNLVVKEQIQEGQLDVNFDIYKEYRYLYDLFLEKFNREFPQND